jgi:glutaconate CoA-transferase subunit A
VAHVQGGAYPSPVQGYYGRDHAAFGEYHAMTRERSGFLKWLQDSVLDVPDHTGYLRRLGERFQRLRPSAQRLAAPVDYA